MLGLRFGTVLNIGLRRQRSFNRCIRWIPSLPVSDPRVLRQLLHWIDTAKDPSDQRGVDQLCWSVLSIRGVHQLYLLSFDLLPSKLSPNTAGFLLTI